MRSLSINAPSSPAAPRRRFPLWTRIIAVGVIVALAAFAVMALQMGPGRGPVETASTRLSDQGSYRVSYVPDLSPVPINVLQSWTLRVAAADGQPVDDAAITVDGGMPDHGHGLPTAPQVTPSLGDGAYQVDGLKFNMSGWWVVTFRIVRDGVADTVTFNLMLNEG